MKLSICFIFFPLFAIAQYKYDNIWMFGPWEGYGTVLDFGSDIKVFEKVNFFFNINEGASMISDDQGFLKYYSNGCSVASGLHQLISGTEDLNSGYFHDNYCFDGFGYPFVDQSMVFLPFADTMYSLFYKHEDFTILSPTEYSLNVDKIFRTNIINNKAQVVDHEVLIDTLSFGCMAAVRHPNLDDYWLVTPHDSSNIYFILRLTSDLNSIVEEKGFGDLNKRNHNGSKAKFSPDGELYVGYEPSYLEQSIKVFSFDGEIGNLEYKFALTNPDTIESLVGGVEFSPSGRFLYVSTRTVIFQYDLDAPDVQASKMVVAEWDGFTDLYPCTFHAMQRGPDCRIYINSPSSQKYLHVIMHPDVKGPDCEVRQHEIPLYYYHQISMPYFPNYRLGTGEPVCDSTLALPTSIPVFTLPMEGVKIWPNPASSECRLMLSPSVLRTAVAMDVVDLWGRSVLTRDLTTNYEEVIPIDVSLLIPGVYFLRVSGRQGERWLERLVVGE